MFLTLGWKVPQRRFMLLGAESQLKRVKVQISRFVLEEQLMDLTNEPVSTCVEPPGVRFLQDSSGGRS